MEISLKSFYLAFLFFIGAKCLENLSQQNSYSGLALQSHSYKTYLADKAVDGYLEEEHGESTCSITLAKEHFKEAWWKLPLKRISNVAYLEIYFRNSTINRNTGFAVFVFNDSSFVPPYCAGERVFTQDHSTCPSRVMNVNINKITQGIALYNSKDPPLQTNCTGYEPTFSTIEICEIKIMGCPSGHYGENCTSCNPRCRKRQCDAFNGSCIHGCNNTFMEEPHCVCVNGYYGELCDRSCGNCLDGVHCDKLSGFCPNGCQEGWSGLKCDECQEYTYGSNCSFVCGHCKNDTSCSKTHGICKQGCEIGWKGPLCLNATLSADEDVLQEDFSLWKTLFVIICSVSTFLVVTLIVVCLRVLHTRKGRIEYINRKPLFMVENVHDYDRITATDNRYTYNNFDSTLQSNRHTYNSVSSTLRSNRYNRYTYDQVDSTMEDPDYVEIHL